MASKRMFFEQKAVQTVGIVLLLAALVGVYFFLGTQQTFLGMPLDHEQVFDGAIAQSTEPFGETVGGKPKWQWQIVRQSVDASSSFLEISADQQDRREVDPELGKPGPGDSVRGWRTYVRTTDLEAGPGLVSFTYDLAGKGTVIAGENARAEVYLSSDKKDIKIASALGKYPNVDASEQGQASVTITADKVIVGEDEYPRGENETFEVVAYVELTLCSRSDKGKPLCSASARVTGINYEPSIILEPIGGTRDTNDTDGSTDEGSDDTGSTDSGADAGTDAGGTTETDTGTGDGGSSDGSTGSGSTSGGTGDAEDEELPPTPVEEKASTLTYIGAIAFLAVLTIGIILLYRRKQRGRTRRR